MSCKESTSIVIVLSAVLWITATAVAQEPVELSALESDYLSNVRQITDRFEKAGEGYFSQDGNRIVFQAVPPGYPFYQIYTQAFDGSAPKLISTGRGRTTCSYFSPDGTRILFASSHLDPDLYATEAEERKQLEEDRRLQRHRRYSWAFDPHMDIFETDLDGRIQRQLTDTPGYDAEGAYSSDGQWIAFCSTRDGDPDIYLMRSDGSDVKQLTNAQGYDGGPFISPDGKWIIFRSDRKKAEYLQIHVIGIDGSHEKALTENVGVNWGPYWHPTQPYIIWAGADHSDPQSRPNYDLWVARYAVTNSDFSIGQPLRITDSANADVLPVFSPDGKKLMWTSTRTKDRSSQLFLGDIKLPAAN